MVLKDHSKNEPSQRESLDQYRERGNKELLIKNNPLSLYPGSLTNLLDKSFPSTRWLVDSLIPSEGLTIISAAPGSFKTWAMLEIALVVASGRKLFEHFPTHSTGVLIVDEESGERVLNERFKQLGAAKNLPIMNISRERHIVTPDYIDSLISVCLANNIGLVMFDSLSRIHQSDENTSKDMSQLFDQLRRIVDQGIAVLIAHHNRKAGAGMAYNPSADMRGSGDILASADCHIALVRQGSGDYITIYQTKNRYKREIAPFKLRFIENGEKSEFQLMEVLQSRDEVHSELKQAVLSVVVASPLLTKKQLLDKLQKSGINIKNARLGSLLQELITDEKVLTESGIRNAVHYRTDLAGSASKAQ